MQTLDGTTGKPLQLLSYTSTRKTPGNCLAKTSPPE
ncbi:hypothetical protein ACVW0Y_002614 [Pseudomonas sp. TE3786]